MHINIPNSSITFFQFQVWFYMFRLGIRTTTATNCSQLLNDIQRPNSTNNTRVDMLQPVMRKGLTDTYAFLSSITKITKMMDLVHQCCNCYCHICTCSILQQLLVALPNASPVGRLSTRVALVVYKRSKDRGMWVT